MRYLFLILSICLPLQLLAAGETRETAISVSGPTTLALNGNNESNITTWFKIEPSAFTSADLITISISGKNYGDISIYENEDESPAEFHFIGGSSGLSLNPTIKRLNSSSVHMYIAISQEGEGGSVNFNFSKAQPGETRDNAMTATEGTNSIQASFAPVWYKYTPTSNCIASIYSAAGISNITNENGSLECLASLAAGGFRVQEGNTVYFHTIGNTGSFSITLSDIKPGMFADMPLDITSTTSFDVELPADPNATTDSSAQSERYWIYTAEKSGLLMWGTYDADWINGMWGCTVRDTTAAHTLNTPDTKVIAEMLTYTIPVIAGHTYLIAQTVCYNKARTVTVYAAYQEPQQGDTKEDPIILTLDKSEDLGRTTANTKYYSFTATTTGVYTATIHAAGQVRATTPADGSWNIARNYDIQDRHMHIDNEIALQAGETLLLEITLTSDIDIHANGSDASKPNYSILITSNNSDIKEAREGEDITHAIEAQSQTAYSISQNSDEDYYDMYYKVEVPAGDTLIVTTSHPEAISSPACINFTLDGTHWNEVKANSTFIRNSENTKNIGRQYTVIPSESDRTIYIEVDGVSFLYEGATWSYTISTQATNINDRLAKGSDNTYFTLNGVQIDTPRKAGIYLVKTNGSSNFRKIIIK